MAAIYGQIPGHGSHFRSKCGKNQWFAKIILDRERIADHVLQRYCVAICDASDAYIRVSLPVEICQALQRKTCQKEINRVYRNLCALKIPPEILAKTSSPTRRPPQRRADPKLSSNINSNIFVLTSYLCPTPRFSLPSSWERITRHQLSGRAKRHWRLSIDCTRRCL